MLGAEQSWFEQVTVTHSLLSENSGEWQNTPINSTSTWVNIEIITNQSTTDNFRLIEQFGWLHETSNNSRCSSCWERFVQHWLIVSVPANSKAGTALSASFPWMWCWVPVMICKRIEYGTYVNLLHLLMEGLFNQ